MEKVRKDVIKKLDEGLREKRKAHKEASFFLYETARAKHYIYVTPKGRRYYNSILYDGSHCHSEA